MDKIAIAHTGLTEQQAVVDRWRGVSLADVLDQYAAAEREGLPLLAQQLRVVLDDRLATIGRWHFTTGGPLFDALHGRRAG